MLRCPPSCVGLGASDLANLDAKLAARPSVRLLEMRRNHLRMVPSPTRAMQLGYTAAENNRAARRAASFCSEATICSAEHEEYAANIPRLGDSTAMALTDASDTRQPVSISITVADEIDAGQGVHRITTHRTITANTSDIEGLALQERPHLVPALDPGAQTFVPRIRFASNIRPPREQHGVLRPAEAVLKNSSNTSCASHLRARSSFDRNSDQSVGTQDPTGVSEELHQAQVRHLAHGIDGYEGGALPITLPNLDRYPPLRPPRPAAHHIGRPRMSLQQVTDPPVEVSEANCRGEYKTINARRPIASNSQRLSTTKASSNSSRSTPNLLPSPQAAPAVHTRSNSLTWRSAGTRRDAQESKAKDHTSDGSVAPESSPHNLGSDTMTRLTRDSPLDELSQKLGRMTASRPRSLGASLERNGKGRVSLLSGNFFREEHSQLEYGEEVQRHSSHDQGALSDETDDRLALSMALTAAESPISTHKDTCSLTQSSPVLKISLAENEEMSMSATRSRVPIYNDHISHSTQPQTPADTFRQSHRRAKSRSNADWQQFSSPTNTTVVSERYFHRHTFSVPPATTARSSMGVPALPQIQRHSHESTMPRQVRRTPTAVENDIQSTLQGMLAHEPRLRNDGGLDDENLQNTPPAEGRLERFVS